VREQQYIAVEGPIGVGKTSLARLLAERFESELILETPDENPYLQEFYKDPRKYAFLTQISFLFMRYEQLRTLMQGSLFHQGGVVADYLFAKDRIFASVALDDREWDMYDKISRMLHTEIPEPDLVIYLQASTERLMENIAKRHRPSEEYITRDYLQRLQEAYREHFFQQSPGALLVINTTNLDFIGKPKDFETLVRMIEQPFSGIRYYNPADGIA
jgi:deoxyadenosine/deoxycytidine kinase